VAGGPDAASESLEWTADLLRRIGKQPLVMKRFAIGFIANKIMMAMGAAAEELMDDGAATLEDIDFVMKDGVVYKQDGRGARHPATDGGGCQGGALSSSPTLSQSEGER